jgi:hypothetical protein
MVIDPTLNGENMRFWLTFLIGLVFAQFLSIWHEQDIIQQLKARTFRMWKNLVHTQSNSDTIARWSSITFFLIHPVYHPLPMSQLKKLQRVQNAAASFDTNKYCRTGDVLSLGWLPVQERIVLELMRFAHRSIWDPTWPQYLRLELHTSNRQFRSSCAPSLKIPLETGTFQDSCSKFLTKHP